jgi:hypothetical protein
VSNEGPPEFYLTGLHGSARSKWVNQERVRGILRHLITTTLRLSPKWKLQRVARATGLAAALAAILGTPTGFAVILIWAGWSRIPEEGRY